MMEVIMEPFLEAMVIVLALCVVWVGVSILYRVFANAVRGCPHCHTRVTRLRRLEWEKRLGVVFPDLRRYACPACGWEGLLMRKGLFRNG